MSVHHAMKIIAHRGNTHGPNPECENMPKHIEAALGRGFDVEVDVWHHDGELWLGHDKPQYKTNMDFLLQPMTFEHDKIWCHAKNISALEALLRARRHCFWHENDRYTVTSRGYIWTYPGQSLTCVSIAVCTDDYQPITECAGYCSDYVGITK
jgi:hypothetical protein